MARCIENGRPRNVLRSQAEQPEGPDGPDVLTGKTNGVGTLQSFWFIKSDQLGKISVGKQSQASDNAAILPDGSGFSVVVSGLGGGWAESGRSGWWVEVGEQGLPVLLPGPVGG